MKRHIILFLIAIFAPLAALSQQMVWNQRYQEYIDIYKDVAIEQMLKYDIPASITLAQGVLESGAGKSELTRRSNNHFGIKCHGWSGRTSYHDDDERGECFRAYDNAYQSYEDHSKFLRGSQRYKPLFKMKRTDYKGWAKGLKTCGYATSPTYATKLINIIQLYKLHRYDTEKHYDKDQVELVRRQNGLLRHILTFNNNKYVVARKGDTFRDIGADVKVSYRKLARYNERDKDAVLEEGEYVWLKKKQRKAPKDYEGRLHYVRSGESMYSISQKYGIRLKRLYKLNGLSPDYVLHVGDGLKLR